MAYKKVKKKLTFIRFLIFISTKALIPKVNIKAAFHATCSSAVAALVKDLDTVCGLLAYEVSCNKTCTKKPAQVRAGC